MNCVFYQSGEPAKVGDVVVLAGQKGKVTVLGDDLLEWGLTKEEIENGSVMIEFGNGALVCTYVASEDLVLIQPAT